MTASLITLSVRDTHKYRAAWKHLDQWHDASWQYELLSSRQIPDTDLDDGYISKDLIRTTCKLSTDGLLNAFRGQYAAGCECEHDCCGHYFGGLHDVQEANGQNTYLLIASYSRNY